MKRAKKTAAPIGRLDNWPSLLESAMRERWSRPFRWGEQDCCKFAATLVEAMSGQDLARGFGRYKGQLGAARILKRAGGVEGLMEGVAARHGMQEWPGVAYARRGDVCLIKTEGGEALGVCVGQKIAGAGPNGVELVPIEQARRAWRVG